jgi:hypothetical protein
MLNRAIARVGVMVASAATPLPNVFVQVPMACSHGPKGGAFTAGVHVPSTVPHGATYTVTIDGVPSGKIAHFGLRYIHDMETDFAIPPGTVYVQGSARVVPGTGTPNVLAGATATYASGLVSLALPAPVASGSSYTPPSIAFDLLATAPLGASLPLAFAGYRVAAKAVIVGDVQTVCESVPKHITIATTSVAEAAP